MGTLIKEMLFYQRQYIIDKVKAPLMKAIIHLAMRFPKPTKDNTVFKNTHIRLEVAEYILNNLTARGDVVEAGLRILIDECEHDGFYEFLHDTYITELLKRGWQPNERGFPMYRYWKGKLGTDYCMESNPKMFAAWMERRDKNALIENRLSFIAIK